MKQYKIQNRSQKNSHSCLPLTREICVLGKPLFKILHALLNTAYKSCFFKRPLKFTTSKPKLHKSIVYDFLCFTVHILLFKHSLIFSTSVSILQFHDHEMVQRNKEQFVDFSPPPPKKKKICILQKCTKINV